MNATGQALAELVGRLIDIALYSALGTFATPILTLLFVLRFLRWAHSRARGGSDAEELADQAGDYRRRLERAPGRVRDAAKTAFRRRY